MGPWFRTPVETRMPLYRSSGFVFCVSGGLATRLITRPGRPADCPQDSNKQVPWPERTIPTERPPLIGKVSANFCG
jgi:hypothetical protein